MSKLFRKRLSRLEGQKPRRLVVAVRDLNLASVRLSDGRHFSNSEFEKYKSSLGPETTLQIVQILDNREAKA